jgi:dCMP deaminase
MHSKSSADSTAIISYVPALHAGYVKFFAKYPDAHIYVLGRDFIDAFPRLNRDLRALAPEEVVTALTALGFTASVLNQANFSDLAAATSYILPDEDVAQDFAEKHLSGRRVEFESMFLRWDGVFSSKESEAHADREVTIEAFHTEIMQKAIAEAARSADWWRQIGAVLVQNGELLALAHIRHFPSDLALDIFGTPRITVDFGERPDLYISMHAEADIVAQAAAKGIVLEGASLYTTTFPCINCAFLIARSGIKKLYFKDGYSKLDSDGVLSGAGVEIVRVSGL